MKNYIDSQDSIIIDKEKSEPIGFDPDGNTIYDTVSIIYNNRIVVDRKELNVKNPIKFGLRVSNNPSANQLIFVAENLGYDPPNTAVMIITDKNNKRQEIILNTDLTHNEVVKFIKIVKN